MKIVVVEDNQILAKSIAKVLKQEGHSIQCFADGLLARSFLFVERGSIDLVIMDYMLPGMDGIELITAMREEEISIPVLMLTAKGGISDKVLGLKSGADYYLTKPFEFDELLACIEALHRRPKQFVSETISVAEGVYFNVSTHTVLSNSETILLTPTEAGIFEYLLRNRGKIVSQHELSEHVFDFAKENWSNTLEVHIKNLRKKLNNTHYENPIKTVRGAGYRVEI